MKITIKDYIKANKRANRLLELEFSTGWQAKNKIFKSKKTYTRKTKHKDSI